MSLVRRRSCAIINSAAAKTPTATTLIMIVAMALMSGVTPNLTLEKTNIGKVLAPGPEAKPAMTKSSKDKVKDNNQPVTIAGKIIGRVMSHSTRRGRAPKSVAASSTDLFMPN